MEDLRDKLETALEAIEIAHNVGDGADAMEAIADAIIALNQSALDIYSANGGFTARAEGYWFAHVRSAVNGSYGHAPTMRSAAEELREENRTECESCGDKFDPELLQLDPETEELVCAECL
jgi:hypothetical protein